MAFKWSELDKKTKSRIQTGIFLLAVVIFFIVNNVNGEEGEGPYPPNYNPNSPRVESKAPDFSLLSVSGEPVKLSDYSGKVVIIDFWATWCGPCRRGIPDLVQLKEKYSADDIEIIGISLDGVTRDGSTVKDIEPFMKEFKINYPIVQGTSEIMQQYGGIRSIPTSFIIDKSGKIAAHYTQLIPYDIYDNMIKKLLK